MLERVPLLERQLSDYAGIVGVDVVDRIAELAEPLQGARVLHLNATAYGGGVAELLATHVPLLRSVGIEADWEVMHGSDEFFAVTKEVHNALQGADVEWTARMQKTYLEKVLDNALLFDGHYDFVVVHDPQPAAMLSFLRERLGGRMADTKWIWRCHIDLTDANPKVWEFFRPFVELHDASVWTMPEFIPASLDMDRVVTAPPCIDPLSVKNLDLALPFCQELTRQYGIDVHRPIVCQVSRFDPWKDPVGVIEAFRIVRDKVPDAQLLLAGSMATDDPEGFRVWEQCEEARGGDRDIFLLSNLHQVGSVQINAFQRISDVVLQKSLREGFGLTVSEGLWKGRPVIGGRAGGIKLQIRDGFDGFLVDSIEECAQRTIELLADPVGADALGVQGREHVRDNFLSTRELDDWLRLFTDLRGMIIVSHRGPFGFSVDASGAVQAVRGPGGLAGTLHHLVASGALADATCVSAALGDGDHRVATGAPHPDVGTDVCFVELDPEAHRLHYEVVSNEVLWFLFHGIFDLPRSPTFGHAFRDAWAAYVEVNRAFADRVAELARDGELVLVQDYPLGLVPGMLAVDRPDLHLCYFAHTPFSGPGGMRMLPDHVAFELSASLACRPCGFHTRRWADAYEGSTRMVLGADAVIAPTFAASLGPDPAGLAASAASPAVLAARAELDELVGDRALLFRSDRIDLTKNIARGFMAYDELLATYPEWRERVVFVAKLNASRASVPEYAAYSAETERAAERVNERWATSSWTPLVVDTSDDYERTIAGFLRYDVLLVNPIKDGLNLVAKEGPLVNTRDGVLCLSPEAGAYEELRDGALRVHPYDLTQTAATLHGALSMPADERAPRATALRAAAAERTPAMWLDDLIAHAR